MSKKFKQGDLIQITLTIDAEFYHRDELSEAELSGEILNYLSSEGLVYIPATLTHGVSCKIEPRKEVVYNVEDEEYNKPPEDK